MNRDALVRALLRSRQPLADAGGPPRRKTDAEGGCGVIGMASSVPVAGHHLLRSLEQMRNRGNGKGGGIAAVGLDPDRFGVDEATLRNDYLLAVALLDGDARAHVEAEFVRPSFEIDHALVLPSLPDYREIPGLEVAPPQVLAYFVRVKPEVRDAFMRKHGVAKDEAAAAEDEVVYQNSARLNKALYASTGEKRAFVLSHGKDLLVLKLVGYGEDVVRFYRLEDLAAHVWIGHHRYPTKGRVWHPGGAHPFIGMHEALVHNGDFANYASIASYLAQRNIFPLFLTDTEVAALVFDLLHRVYGYPLEAVIEALAPTTERDFTLLPADKQRLYAMLQRVHIHGSPDGPWFFLVAQSDPRERAYRLVGITDTSMLRPQVFALQRGEAAIGFAASEKQGIDAALASIAAEDGRFWPRPDLVWNARGGSHTDGGAFIFNVAPANGHPATLTCTDKFGHLIEPDPAKRPPAPRPAVVRIVPSRSGGTDAPRALAARDLPAAALFADAARRLVGWEYGDLTEFLAGIESTAAAGHAPRAIDTLTLLLDRRVATGAMKRSGVLALVDESLARVIETIRHQPPNGYVTIGHGEPLPEGEPERTLAIDARGFPPEGPDSLARTLVRAYEKGFKRFLIANVTGQRFIGCGLGIGAQRVRIDVYGSSGDYLASGIDGAEVMVHGSGQDQLAQIMKDGLLVVHGDVGQTFGYAAKGGRAFILGNAAGRPLINAVGKPRVVINGTCLDYLAESFMAGDPLAGGGFVVLNGVAFDEGGTLVELPTPYPGGNLFSLASGGAIYLRDPRRRVSEEQLNGGAFVETTAADWALIEPVLAENERLFGIPLTRLLEVDGGPREPRSVYRKIAPAGHEALQPEEAWVRKEG
jgi:glutamate synthase domain-containing protein 1/glutamate synthase domain-containing protein 3